MLAGTLFTTACSTFPVNTYCERSKTHRLGPSDQPQFDEVYQEHVGRYVAHVVWIPEEGRVPEPGIIDELYFEFTVPEGKPVEVHSELEPASQPWCPDEAVQADLHVSVRGQDGRFRGATDVPIRVGKTEGFARLGWGGNIPIDHLPETWVTPLPVDEDGWELLGFEMSAILPTTYDGELDAAVPQTLLVAVYLELQHGERGTRSDQVLYEGLITDFTPVHDSGG